MDRNPRLAPSRPSPALFCLIGVAFALASTLPARAARESQPVPEGAWVALEFSKGTNFVLGDVIEMTFVLSNSGPASFDYETGGDYRGTGFPTRYKFAVMDEQDLALPKETWMEMGGMVGPHTLGTGQVHRESLRLQNYVRVDQPGTLKLRVTHDFGWKSGADRPLLAAQATIRLTLPTPDQAEARVKQILSVQQPPKDYDPRRSWDQNDFRYLGHPVFLPALEKQARAGVARAVEGLHRMSDTNSTLALVRLLANNHAEVVHAAAFFLSLRMPPRTINGHPSRPFGVFSEEERLANVKLWVPEAANALRTCARELLRSTNVDYVRSGAFIIEAIGTTEDARAVLESMHATLQTWTVRDKPEDNILNAPGAGDSLIAALAGLRERGYRSPGNGGVEVIMARFLELADPQIPRREGWEQLLGAFFSQNPPMLREAAVRALPQPPTGEWEKLLLDALNDRDRGVMREACRAAGTSGNPVFVTPLANIVRTEQQRWVVSEGSQALTALGAHWEATEAWIERLSDENLWFEAMRFLVEKLEHPKSEGGSSGNRPTREGRVALRRKWEQFFSGNERQALVQAGKPVPITPEEARDLLGRSFSISLEGGKSWPP